MTPTDSQSGILYVVATPLGNLEDISLRALRILKEVDFIAAEDTRHTRKLLTHFDIHTPLKSYYRENEYSRAGELIEQLREGKSIALVSDAGTPGISDPGATVVQRAHEAGIQVCPIPGPSALTAALSASGLDTPHAMFCGFPPAKSGQRRKLLTSLALSNSALVFYESPRRIKDFFADALMTLGDRKVLVAREITKTFETIRQTSLAALAEDTSQTEERGEYAVIIWPSDQQQPDHQENLDELLVWYRDHSGLSLKDASRKLSDDLGLSKSEIYQKALAIWKQ